MAFADEIISAGVKIAPLCELDLPDGTKYFSTYPVEYGGHIYEPRIIEADAIQRELSSINGGLQPSELTLSIANEDAAFNKQSIAQSVNRAFTVKIWANGQVQTFFVGLAKLQYEEGLVRLSITDKAKKYFGTTNHWWAYLTAEDWPGMPYDDIKKVAPLVLGAHDSRNCGYQGMLPTIKLSPSLYMVAGHACKSVGPVFVGGEEQLSNYTVHLDYYWADGINSLATIIEFKVAPSSTPTCDAQGLTATRTSAGELLDNPVDIMEALREYVFGLSDSDVNSTEIAATKDYCTTFGLKAAGYVATEIPPQEILGDILACFFLWGGWDNDGKWTIRYIDYPLADGGGISISERFDIIKGSFQVLPDEDQACNQLTISFLQSYAGSGYHGILILEDATSQTAMGDIYSRDLRLPWCTDIVTARTLGEFFLNHLKYGAGVAAWGEQLQHSASLDLGEQIAITDMYAPSDDGGWDDAEFMITQLSLDLINAVLQVSTMDVRPWVTAIIGSNAELGDTLPWTLI